VHGADLLAPRRRQRVCMPLSFRARRGGQRCARIVPTTRPGPPRGGIAWARQRRRRPGSNRPRICRRSRSPAIPLPRRPGMPGCCGGGGGRRPAEAPLSRSELARRRPGFRC